MKATGRLRFKVCPDCGEMHDKYHWPDNHRRPEEVLASPSVVRDEMEPVQAQHNGVIYTSKRAIRASYLPSGNAEGVRYIELGNDPQRNKPKLKPKPDRKAIKDAVLKATARFDRGERTTDARKFA